MVGEHHRKANFVQAQVCDLDYLREPLSLRISVNCLVRKRRFDLIPGGSLAEPSIALGNELNRDVLEESPRARASACAVLHDLAKFNVAFFIGRAIVSKRDGRNGGRTPLPSVLPKENHSGLEPILAGLVLLRAYPKRGLTLSGDSPPKGQTPFGIGSKLKVQPYESASMDHGSYSCAV